MSSKIGWPEGMSGTMGLYFYKDYDAGWPGRIPKKYQTKEVYARYCELRYNGIDGEASILSDIAKWEKDEKHGTIT